VPASEAANRFDLKAGVEPIADLEQPEIILGQKSSSRKVSLTASRIRRHCRRRVQSSSGQTQQRAFNLIDTLAVGVDQLQRDSDANLLQARFGIVSGWPTNRDSSAVNYLGVSRDPSSKTSNLANQSPEMKPSCGVQAPIFISYHYAEYPKGDHSWLQCCEC
jgi:hypothetical protein